MMTKDKFEKLTAAAYKSASDAVGSPGSSFDEEHESAFHEALDAAVRSADETTKETNKMEIRTLKGKVLFTHSAEKNTLMKTLEKAVIGEVDLKDANLEGADLGDTDLEDVDLRGANLRDVDFTGSNLTDADLRGADLRGSNYTKDQITSTFVDETTTF